MKTEAKCPKCGSEDCDVAWAKVEPKATDPDKKYTVSRKLRVTCSACGHFWDVGNSGVMEKFSKFQ